MTRPMPMVRKGGGTPAHATSTRRSAGPPPSPNGLPIKFLDNHEIRRIMKNQDVLSAVPALRNFDMTTKADCCTEAKVESDQIATTVRQFIAKLPQSEKTKLKQALKAESVQYSYKDASGVYVRDQF